jgi:hypothetical protein
MSDIKKLRDAPKPDHVVPSGCLTAGTVDQDGYCTACGEKAIRGPITYWTGVKK